MTDRDFPLNDSSFYANVFSYLGLPFSRDLDGDAVDAVVMGIPYDLGTSGRAGARSGPAAIRQASANLRWEEQRWPWDFKLAGRLGAIDYGDLEFTNFGAAYDGAISALVLKGEAIARRQLELDGVAARPQVVEQVEPRRVGRRSGQHSA